MRGGGPGVGGGGKCIVDTGSVLTSDNNKELERRIKTHENQTQYYYMLATQTNKKSTINYETKD